MTGRQLDAAGVCAQLTLHGAVAAVSLAACHCPDAEEQRRVRWKSLASSMTISCRRLATIDAPLLAVVGGSTGAGKSTLVNSLVGRRVSAPGVIRPTTRAPVLVHHSSDAAWFTDDRILPGLARSTGAADGLAVPAAGRRGLDPARSGAALTRLTSTPVVAENRQLAAQLLAAADLWLFVTSAARYADAVPWDFLRAAADRSAAVAVVLDRVPPRAMTEVPPHLGQLMSERGLGELAAVRRAGNRRERRRSAAGERRSSRSRGWLARLWPHDQASRAEVVHQTLDGAIARWRCEGARLAAVGR